MLGLGFLLGVFLLGVLLLGVLLGRFLGIFALLFRRRGGRSLWESAFDLTTQPSGHDQHLPSGFEIRRQFQDVRAKAYQIGIDLHRLRARDQKRNEIDLTALGLTDDARAGDVDAAQIGGHDVVAVDVAFT